MGYLQLILFMLSFIHNQAAICGKLFNFLTIATIIRVCAELLTGCSRMPQYERQSLHISLSVCTSISQPVNQSVSQSVCMTCCQSVTVLCHTVPHASTFSTALHYAHFLLTSSFVPPYIPYSLPSFLSCTWCRQPAQVGQHMPGILCCCILVGVDLGEFTCHNNAAL